MQSLHSCGQRDSIPSSSAPVSPPCAQASTLAHSVNIQVKIPCFWFESCLESHGKGARHALGDEKNMRRQTRTTIRGHSVGEGGYSLLELLVVLSLVGIFSTIGVYNLNNLDRPLQTSSAQL
ncbi:MAG: prepilin-type N-terminal cleavage/methylation domain-containing protein, partial [Bdellovibrionales bacterium]|nr:prepilin-type N-terminal cleavage/methylation domain-containing protein [Bdellovibrionales bacterium]